MADYGLWQKNEEEIKEGVEGMKILTGHLDRS
jgi:hypothetical protein